jgi:hypothetical protein
MRTRTPRFPLHLVVRCRPVGASDWRVGRTENISSTGVLMRYDEPIAVDLPVELRVEMPMMAAGNEAAEIWCRGRVVRAVSGPRGDTRVKYAVAIEQYYLQAPSAGSQTQDAAARRRSGIKQTKVPRTPGVSGARGGQQLTQR